MGELRKLDKTGDTKIIWDPDKQDEVDAAEETFNRLIKKGYNAFEVGLRGKKTSRKVTKFDPNLEKLILAPALQGG